MREIGTFLTARTPCDRGGDISGQIARLILGEVMPELNESLVYAFFRRFVRGHIVFCYRKTKIAVFFHHLAKGILIALGE
jgi:hypothetical protein